jgi:hypothetical protein
MVDIGRIKDLLGLGEDKSEPLEQALERQLIPDVREEQQERKIEQLCSWCEKPCDRAKDGFHLVHVAFGVAQERHAFCSDECYEAFRRLYPSRVHRNCYERKCAECHYCIKRYAEESEGFRLPDKDAAPSDDNPPKKA